MDYRKKLVNKKNILSLFLVFALLLCLSPKNITYAYSLFGGKLSSGANTLLYYNDSSTNEYKDSINYGFSYWNNKSSKVKIARTDYKADSRCDNYWGTYFPSGSTTIAQTTMYLNNQVLNDLSKDWYWCDIKYNSNVYKYEDSNGGGLSYFDRQGTACHELGHVLGLAHTNSTKTNVMCQLGSGRSVNKPSTDDINGVKAIYGN